MSDAKRSITAVSSESEHDDKKLHAKLGRKPIETEPKSKRTAQNRAAQRAYRERKERKMKDLEEKVMSLEDENLSARNEQGVLKAQVEMLKAELSRYRGHLDFSDLALPTFTPTSLHKGSSLSSLATSHVSAKLPDVPSEFSLSGVPGLSTLLSSPLNDNVIVSPELYTSDALVSNRKFSNLFEEQLDPFCANLSQACGTRQKPVPTFKRDSQQFPAMQDLPLKQLFVPNTAIPDQFFSLDGLDSSNLFAAGTPAMKPFDTNFDLELGLGNIVNDPITAPMDYNDLGGLVTEDSVYDQVNLVNTDFNFNEFISSSYSGLASRKSSETAKPTSSVSSFNSPPVVKEEPNDDSLVVPAPEKTMKCLEIWDRITSHPRYTEIDIDGLCSELKTKAKCSEMGVVLNVNDVNRILERSAIRTE